jgi:hypothetical protein
MNLLALAVLALAMSATSVHAADPTAVIVDSSVPDLTFQEYTGSQAVGEGRVNSDVLYFIDEQIGPFGKSWYIFFDPLRTESVSATITFSDMIAGVFIDKTDLDASNQTYGAAGITYGTSSLIGLEPRTDSLSFSGNQLTINLVSNSPGDHFRVFTASPVPEPGAASVLAAGLVLVVLSAQRTRRKRAPAPGRR